MEVGCLLLLVLFKKQTKEKLRPWVSTYIKKIEFVLQMLREICVSTFVFYLYFPTCNFYTNFLFVTGTILSFSRRSRYIIFESMSGE